MRILEYQAQQKVTEYCYCGDGEPLVFVHGVGLNFEAWEPQLHHFSKSHRVVAINLPGHGKSVMLEPNSNLEDFVNWLHEVLTGLSLQNINLVGHSLGALICAGYAITHSEKVRRVALLSCVYKRSKEARLAVIKRLAKATKGTIEVESTLQRWYDDAPQFSDLHAQTKSWLKSTDAEAYAQAYQAFAFGDTTFAKRLCEIECPALVLTGGADPNSTELDATKISDQIPNSILHVVPNHRHMVNLTSPVHVNATLQQWLECNADSPDGSL